MLERLSIVIPTYNGIERLIHLCRWIKNQNFDGTLIVVSSDDIDHSKDFSKFEFVRFFHRPKTNVLEAMVIGFQNVNSRYCCYLGDDDLPTLVSYQKCCDFLDDNSEYGSARGAMGFVDYIAFQKFHNSDLTEKFLFLFRYFLSDRYDGYSDLSFESRNSRITMVLNQYIVSQFFITRSHIAKTLYSKDWSGISDHYLAERVWCFLHAASTRTKFVSGHFLMRGLGAYREPSVEVGGNLASGVRMATQKKYVHSVIKKLAFNHITNDRLLNSIFERRQKKLPILPRGVSKKIFWLKRLPRRFHFIFKYQVQAPLFLFRLERRPFVNNKK